MHPKLNIQNYLQIGIVPMMHILGHFRLSNTTLISRIYYILDKTSKWLIKIKLLANGIFTQPCPWGHRLDGWQVTTAQCLGQSAGFEYCRREAVLPVIFQWSKSKIYPNFSVRKTVKNNFQKLRLKRLKTII